MSARLLTAVALASVCIASAAYAQDSPPPAEPAAARPSSPMDQATAKAAVPHAEAAGADARIAMPESPSEVVLKDAATRQRYLESMQRYYEYRSDGYAYRSRVFEWQLISSKAIFVVVLVLVMCGIYFAWVQFRAAMIAMHRKAAVEAAAKDAPNPLATQFEVSSKGIVINSSVLGVIILGLSLAFFYLYLVYVYPIQNVF